MGTKGHYLGTTWTLLGHDLVTIWTHRLIKTEDDENNKCDVDSWSRCWDFHPPAKNCTKIETQTAFCCSLDLLQSNIWKNQMRFTSLAKKSLAQHFLNILKTMTTRDRFFIASVNAASFLGFFLVLGAFERLLWLLELITFHMGPDDTFGRQK